MLLTVPFVMYGVFRVLYLMHTAPRLPDDPTVVVWQDRPRSRSASCCGA